MVCGGFGGGGRIKFLLVVVEVVLALLAAPAVHFPVVKGEKEEEGKSVEVFDLDFGARIRQTESAESLFGLIERIIEGLSWSSERNPPIQALQPTATPLGGGGATTTPGREPRTPSRSPDACSCIPRPLAHTRPEHFSRNQKNTRSD
eukprot:GABV01002882.1.p2 GENE.GABV01002882.1~~GABV01002882.1.p2  ORF type:complete len:147 (+),score=45.38 GABV01002882.1:198-638(+)